MVWSNTVNSPLSDGFNPQRLEERAFCSNTLGGSVEHHNVQASQYPSFLAFRYPENAVLEISQLTAQPGQPGLLPLQQSLLGPNESIVGPDGFADPDQALGSLGIELSGEATHDIQAQGPDLRSEIGLGPPPTNRQYEQYPPWPKQWPPSAGKTAGQLES